MFFVSNSQVKINHPLVTVAWLHEHINTPNLLILDATLPKVTLAKTIKNIVKKQLPDARFFDIKDAFSDANARFPNTMLSAIDFQKQAQKLGVNKDHCIVVYDDHGVYSSARAWWMFKAMGFQNIAVLDGGLPAWITAGFDVEDPIKRDYEKGNFEAKPVSDMFIGQKEVFAAVENGNVQLLDARSSARFHGRAPEPRAGVKSGHIPRAKSLPYSGILYGNRLFSEEALRAIFREMNPDDKKMIFSCGTGITACVLALGAEVAGYTEKSVYDGSWTEWGSLTHVPIEV